MVKFVEVELDTIKKEIEQMWTLVRQQLEDSCKAVCCADEKLADKVVSREKRVNAFELKIDSDIEDFIALYNPVAVDLRFALAMLKINTGLERLGDYAEGIARFVIRTGIRKEDTALLTDLKLKECFDIILEMFNMTFEALKSGNIGIAKSVFEKDDRLDNLYYGAIDGLAAFTEKHPEKAHFCIEASGVFRKLERAGDHINNLSEETVFYIDAEVLKHKSLKAEDKDAEA